MLTLGINTGWFKVPCMIGALHDISPGKYICLSRQFLQMPKMYNYAKMFLGGFFNLLKIVLMCTPGHVHC